MKINVHAGHNPSGKIGSGAKSLLDESKENRIVKELVIEKLKALGHRVYDCTVDNGKSQSDILNKIIAKCNAHKVDIDLSIHFNAGRNDLKGDGKNGGVECYINASAKGKELATKICSRIEKLGFTNRGVKTTTSLYYLRKCKNPAILIECCFVDDKDDKKLYDADKMSDAIVTAITGDKKATASKTEYYPQYKGNSYSIVAALNSLNINSSKENRKKIAKANGIKNYSFTAEENIKLLALLRKGKLKKV